MAIHWQGRLLRPLDATGIILGTLLFCASLTPSLLPRTFVVQGVLSGVSFAIGYLIGTGLITLWRYLELPVTKPDNRRGIRFITALICLILIVTFLWQTREWQNSIRSVMELPPIESGHPTKVGLIALGVALTLGFLGRFFALVSTIFAKFIRRFVPRRLANFLGLTLALTLSWMVLNGVIFDFGIRAADSSLKRVDALIEPDVPRPEEPLKTGSSQSLISWESLGRRGREFVGAGPSAADISRQVGGQAQEPIRVYAGLNTAETPRERAQIALKELIRTGGFERSTLLIISPTGTGWIDPEGINSAEYMHRGDIASIAVQYSYLTSPLALLTDPEYGVETTRELFNTVYDYWSHLPKDTRPKLYLYGLSLGSLNLQKATDLYDVVSDPFQGALWAGPPFNSPTWNMATDGRVEGTPVWLPRFRDSSIIRFANQYTTAHMPDVEWGVMRILYLQHASDPISFFKPSYFYRKPQWLDAPRGPDISPSLRWFPVVTALQLLIDLANSTNAPMGYGHLFAAEHYIDAWMEVTAPPNWTNDDSAKLKAYFKANPTDG